MENNQKPNHIDNTNKNRLWELAVDYFKGQNTQQGFVGQIRNRFCCDNEYDKSNGKRLGKAFKDIVF